MDDKDFLNHYGVLGMRWGVRRARGSSQKLTREEKKAAKAEKKRQKILSSPTKLYKNRNKFTKSEIEAAMKNMKMERELRSLSRDEISIGSQYANTILAYATIASTAYGVYASPFGQAVRKKIKDNW